VEKKFVFEIVMFDPEPIDQRLAYSFSQYPEENEKEHHSVI